MPAFCYFYMRYKSVFEKKSKEEEMGEGRQKKETDIYKENQQLAEISYFLVQSKKIYIIHWLVIITIMMAKCAALEGCCVIMGWAAPKINKGSPMRNNFLSTYMSNITKISQKLVEQRTKRIQGIRFVNFKEAYIISWILSLKLKLILILSWPVLIISSNFLVLF